MKKLLLNILILICSATMIFGQDPNVPKCELQTLAIEAALGDDTAIYNLAVEFYRGENVPQDYSAAANLWRKAVEQGSVIALNNLGFLTYRGMGVKQNYAEGVRLWLSAAKKGISESQVHLAVAYTDEKFLKFDPIEAYAWATVGKYVATTHEDDESSKVISKMSDDVLLKIIPNMTNSQKAKAENRAKLLIRLYGTIKTNETFK